MSYESEPVGQDPETSGLLLLAARFLRETQGWEPDAIAHKDIAESEQGLDRCPELLRCSLICRITFDPMTIGNLSYTSVYLGNVQKLADHNRRPVETFILPVTDRKFFFLPTRICIILRVAKTRRYTLT